MDHAEESRGSGRNGFDAVASRPTQVRLRRGKRSRVETDTAAPAPRRGSNAVNLGMQIS